MKILTVKMPDGSVWAVPLEVIARHRAACYVEEFDGSLERSLAEDTMPLFLEDSYAAPDWASNNMRWRHVSEHAKQIKEAEPIDFEEAWTMAPKKVSDAELESNAPKTDRMELIKKRRFQSYRLARNLAYIPDCHHHFVRDMADKASIYHGEHNIIGGQLADLTKQQESLLSNLADEYLTPILICKSNSVKEDAQKKRIEHIKDVVLSLRENIENLPIYIHYVIRDMGNYANIEDNNGVFGTQLASMSDSQVEYFENLAETHIKQQTKSKEVTTIADVCQQHNPSQMEP